jgi:hypothetical protein
MRNVEKTVLAEIRNNPQLAYLDAHNSKFLDCAICGSSPDEAAEDVSGRPLRGPAGVYAVIRTGVPRGSSRANRRMTSLWTRTHPWLTASPMAQGVFVPWMAT